MKTLVIADEDTLIGFSFAGVQGIVVNTEAETQRAFEEATRAEDIGILVITEPVASTIRKKVDDWVIGGGRPLVVEIPDAKGPTEGRRTPHEFVKSAIGVKF